MVNSAKANEGKPKLYIIQPSLEEPTRDMQSIYYSRNDPDSEVKEDLKEEDRSLNKKQFNDMTIEEKVLYFSTLPFQVPKVKTQIITDEKSLIGMIQDYQDETVKIIVANKKEPLEVLIGEIKEINLIGF